MKMDFIFWHQFQVIQYPIRPDFLAEEIGIANMDGKYGNIWFLVQITWPSYFVTHLQVRKSEIILNVQLNGNGLIAAQIKLHFW